MVAAIPRPLDERPEALDAVRVDQPVRILDGVIVGGVQHRFAHPVVPGPFVRDEQRSGLVHERLDEPAEPFGAQLAGLCRTGDHSTAALHQADARLLAGASATLRGRVVVVASIPLPGLSADVGFIGFHDAVQQGRLLRVVGHRHANPVHHAPNRWPAHPEIAGDLVGTGGLLSVQHQGDAQEPVSQGNMGPVEYRPDRHGEGSGALLALPPGSRAVAAGVLADPLAVAVGADGPPAPADGFEVGDGLCLGLEGVENLNNCHGFSLSQH